MRPFVVIALLVLLGGGFYSIINVMKKNDTSTVMQTAPNVRIIPIEHASAIIQWGEFALFTDPTGGASAYDGQPGATIILLSDIHGDHLNAETVTSVINPQTILIAPQAVKDLLPQELSSRTIVMHNGDTRTEQGFQITAVPMYNLPESAESRHVKGRGNGYVIEKDGFRVYVAGDTAGIPEMRALTDIDIALVPMNLPYTMGIEEAANAVLEFKPKQIYPYHYRGQDGLADVATFKQLVAAGDPSIEVILAKWYPTE